MDSKVLHVESEYTIEELAHLADVPTTTVRLYQTRGLLPGPKRVGRVGYYGQGHLARLNLVARLQARGFSLAAIKQLADGWEEGRTLEEVLGLERRVPGLIETEPPLELDAAELMSRFPEGSISQDAVQRSAELGLISLTPAGTIVVTDRSFLKVGSALVAMGLPAAAVLDEYERLQSAMDAVVGGFLAVFDRYVWSSFADAGLPDAELPVVAERLERLAELAGEVVDSVFRVTLRRAAERFVSELAPAFDLKAREGPSSSKTG